MPWFPSSSSPTPIALALQGGGAHGAFTWGVLDALLESGRVRIAAASGTSAGALNAIVLAHGLAEGGADGARSALATFWNAVGTRVPLFDAFVVGPPERPGFAPGMRAWMHWTRLAAPAQWNPLGWNPLREIVAGQVDFERLARSRGVQLHVAATHATSGRLRLFSNAEITLDAALASACLPTLHPAVVIDGEPYWDGGYSANPALFPLVESGIADLLIVALGPRVHEGVPVDIEDIRLRAMEFGFHAGYLRELHLLGAASRHARDAWWSPGGLDRLLRRLRTHLIDAQADRADLPAETKLMAHLPLLERLRDLGRARAAAWLDGEGRALGRTSSADLLAIATPGATRPHAGRGGPAA